MRPRILFHIGLEKTGTTSFQHYCGANRRALLVASVLYPSDRLCFGGANHAPLAASYFPEAIARALLIKPWRAERAAAVAALKREIETVAPGATLISSEHFSSRFAPEMIARVAEDFSWADVEIVAVVRDAIPRALSAYATTLASGRRIGLDAFVDELCRADNPYLRGETTIGWWERVFGRDRVRVIAYVEGGDIVEALLRELVPRYRHAGHATRLNASRIGAIPRLLAVFSEGTSARRKLTAEQLYRLEAIASVDRRWLEVSRGIRPRPSENKDYVRERT
jgi:hypothetical protein